MDDDHPGDGPDPGAAAPVTVYWRPGCFFCTRLLRALEREGVAVELRNIWADDDARAFVRRHNRGDETVPTVVVGSQVWTNPEPKVVIQAVGADAPAAGRPAGGVAGRNRWRLRRD